MSKTKIEPEVRDLVIDLARDWRGNIRCASCGNKVVVGGFHLDHIKPEIDSTPEERKDPANLQVLCAPKQGGGCHRRKTKREAQERARKAQGPPKRGKGVVLLAAGAVFTGYAWFSLTGGSGAAGRWLTWCLIAVAVAAVGFVAVSVYMAADDARPRKEDPAAQKSANAAQQAATGLDQKRITSAVREIVGAKGDVKVTIKSADEFTVAYPNTGFDDGTSGDGRAALLEKINAKIPGRWKPHWDTEHDTVRFTRRPDLPRRVPHPGLKGGRPWHVLPIAMDAWFDLMVTSHLLIIGVPNAGKTSLIRAIICAVADSARRGLCEMILCDPKQIELLGFRGWPGVRDVITETQALWDMAIALEEEMDERYRLYREEGVPLSSHRRLIVVIDEFEQFYKRMHRHWLNARDEEGKPLKRAGQRVPPAIDAMQSVLSMARRCGIHVIVGTQSPDATWFGGSGTRENLQGRAAVGPIDAIRARMAFDDSSVGRDIPATAKGRTTIQVEDNEPEEVQTYWVPDPGDPENDNTPEDWAILARLGYQREAA